jgi:phosphopantetheinyl transferase
MPLIKTISTEKNSAGFWSITESTDELLKGSVLSHDELIRFNGFSNDRRKREYLAVRHLLRNILTVPYELTYDKSGKPLLVGSGFFVSVSHSPSMAACMISDRPCGVDVEEMTRNADRISERFLSTEELEWSSALEEAGLVRLICWCVKEAVYKLMGASEVDFAGHIKVMPFEPAPGCEIHALFLKGETPVSVSLNYDTVGNNVVVWGVLND